MKRSSFSQVIKDNSQHCRCEFFNLDFEIPDAADGIDVPMQVITPSKKGATYIQIGPHQLRLNESVAIYEEQTPSKKLKMDPDEDDQSVSTRSRGTTWDDEMLLQFLRAWIYWAEEPFEVWVKGNADGKAKARDTIQKLIT